MRPFQQALDLSHSIITHPANPYSRSTIGKLHGALIESTSRMMRTYPKQRFDLAPVRIGSALYEVRQQTLVHKPFCDLLHFSHAGFSGAPKVLFVAAMSGHHATLSRETIAEFLPDHDVYITDWIDARMVPKSEGRFGLEEYTAYLMEFLELLGPNTHVVGICQAAVPALMAAAVMAADDHPARPRTLSLLAGPIDIRAGRNIMNRITENYPMPLMRKLLIHPVPTGYPGAGRKVFPGIQQLAGFMWLNPLTHVKSNIRFIRDLAQAREKDAARHRKFYDEYYAVMDCTEEFWVETMERIFLRQDLPDGRMEFGGRIIDCKAIRDIALLTLEGEKDDMIAPGVTRAAHDLCKSLPKKLREHHLQPGVGHYGIFNGSMYSEQIAPRMKAFMLRHAAV